MPSETWIVSLDIGTSSVRTLLFNAQGALQDGFGKHCPYDVSSTPDGGVEADADLLLKLADECLTAIHKHMSDADRKPAAIAFDTFWHSFLGVGEDGNPVTPVIHLFDTRSTAQVEALRKELNAQEVHARTGCRLHTSYWPAKLLWLAENRSDAFKKAKRWMSPGEYIFLKVLGDPVASTSMMSGSGLWDQAANQYDSEVLGKLPVSLDQLAPADGMDRPLEHLTEAYRRKWPLFDGIPWYPALGDGACDNIGSGCATIHEFSLMVGTSGAMRAVVKEDKVKTPDGLWCYRVDRKRFVLGGALSNGGEVYAWMRRTLSLPSEEETEAGLQKAAAGGHGLVVLPFFAGERSPYWRADLRAAVTGLNRATKSIDILQAALESVSLRFREIYKLMAESLGAPTRVICSGGALLKSRAWSQMMADAVGVTVTPCLEQEATGRGAALLASERLGAIADVSAVPMQTGPPFVPDPGRVSVYDRMFEKEQRLFDKLFLQP